MAKLAAEPGDPYGPDGPGTYWQPEARTAPEHRAGNDASKWNSLKRLFTGEQPDSPPVYRSELENEQPRTDNIIVPEQVLPLALELELVLFPRVFPARKIILTTGIDETSTNLKVTTTLGLPNPPGMIKIDDEWLTYRETGRTYIMLDPHGRGRRNTQVFPHSKGAQVLYAETIKHTFYLPTADYEK